MTLRSLCLERYARFGVAANLALVTLVFAVNTYAGGFAITENSAKQLGTAFAGASAVAEDGSTVWYNPAGMTLTGETFQLSSNYIDPEFHFADRGSVQNIGSASLPLLPSSRHASDGGKSAVVPNLYYTRPLTDRWFFGLGVTSPFGLATDYDSNWIGRYQSTRSDIKTISLIPAMAYKISDQFSIGASININYMDAQLSNVLDFAAICATLVQATCPNSSLPGQGQFDGLVKNSADDISAGINLGLLWNVTELTRLGAIYRSQIKHTLKGDTEFFEPVTLGGFNALGGLGTALKGSFSDTGNSAKVTLPDSLSVSMVHEFSPKISFLGDLTWTDWADIPELRIHFNNPLTPTAVEMLDWHASWRISIGMITDLNAQWTLRGGLAFDEAPVDNLTARTPRLPDNDRRWASLGLSYRFTPKTTFDIAYSHLFINDTSVNHTGNTGNVLIGSYSSNANIYGLQLNHQF